MTGNRYWYLRGAMVGAVAVLAAAGCTSRGEPRPTTTTAIRSTTTVRNRTTTTAGHGDHGHMPDRLNHPPTEAQKKAALDWVAKTRLAAADLTVAKLKDMHYINIGDGVHWVKPEYIRDSLLLEPGAVESYAVFNGKVAAAMYVYNPKGLDTTIDDVPDIAGNWTMWHNHVLPYRSNDPASDDYYRLGGPYSRTDSPMIHVWLQPNKCGPFASAGVGEGSCIPELANV